MRFFIALELPEESKKQLKQVQLQIEKEFPGIRLTDSDKLHLTLAFVGEQKDSLKEDLIKVLSNASRDIKPFEVTPSYIDGFPNIHHPRVLWVGVKGDVDKLFILRERIKDELEKLHLEIDDRRFVPHIAIGKSTNLSINPSQENNLEKLMTEGFKPISISSVKLFESVPDDGLHQHNTLAEINLS